MAALREKEDSGGRMVLQSPLLAGFGNLVSMLVWVGILAIFILPAFQGDQVDWANMAFVFFIFLATVGAGLLTSLMRTTVTVDPSRRMIQSAQKLLGIPVRSTEMSFNDVEGVAYEYYRQRSGRYSHDAWRVAMVGRDGQRMMVNWNGKQDEMAALAQKMASRTGASLVDNSVKPVSTVQQIFDKMRGQPGEPMGMPNPPMQPPAIEETSPDTIPWQPSMSQEPEPAMPKEDTMTELDRMLSSRSVPAPQNDTAQVSDTVWNLGMPELEQRVASDPLDSDARYALARKYQARGQFERAIEMYQKAMHLDPANAGVQNDMGIALQQRGRKPEAETAYRRAVALDPFSSTAHLNLGLLLRGMSRASEASQEFFQARQNARTDNETRLAEAASTGAKLDPQMSSV